MQSAPTLPGKGAGNVSKLFSHITAATVIAVVVACALLYVILVATAPKGGTG